jgi:hypothetical protein
MTPVKQRKRFNGAKENTKKGKFRDHAARTPRKRWRCGSACAARSKFRVFVIIFGVLSLK